MLERFLVQGNLAWSSMLSGSMFPTFRTTLFFVVGRPRFELVSPVRELSAGQNSHLCTAPRSRPCMPDEYGAKGHSQGY